MQLASFLTTIFMDEIFYPAEIKGRWQQVCLDLCSKFITVPLTSQNDNHVIDMATRRNNFDKCSVTGDATKREPARRSVQ
jgi:hypothetical protein